MQDNFPVDQFLNFSKNEKNINIIKNLTNSLVKSQNEEYLNTDRNTQLNESESDDFNKKTLNIYNEYEMIAEEIKSKIKLHIPIEKYNSYFSSTFTVSNFNDKEITFIVATQFLKKIIEFQYLNIIKKIVKELLANDYNIYIDAIDSIREERKISSKEHFQDFEVKNDISPPPSPQITKNIKPSFKLEEDNKSLENIKYEVNSKYLNHIKKNFGQKIDINKTFDSFIVGPSNNMAFAIAKATAKNPGKNYPQVYIYGNSGLGKTHLLHAICNEVSEMFPQIRICITTANAFMSEMIYAIQNKTDQEFRRKYTDQIDLLIIDDIHELKDKPRTQTEFFHIFNDLQSKGKQLIFTSDKQPREIGGFEDRIKTRLSSALLVEINQPDLETRIAILKKMAVDKDIFIDDEVINFIANCIKNNVRELEGQLIKLGAYSDLMKVPIDLEIAKDQLGISDFNQPKYISIDAVANAVALYFKIPIGDIIGKSRLKEITFARHIAMYMVHKSTKMTLEEIGNYFGKRDHTSIIHGVKKIERIIKEDPSLSNKIYEIETSINI